MPIVLSQHLDGSSGYDDHIGYLYHYANYYFKLVVPGDRFIYYCPAENETGQFYFGCGLIGDVMPDPENEKRHYCELLDYTIFPNPILALGKDGKYLETRSRTRYAFQRAIRKVSDSIYDTILSKTGLEQDLFASEIPTARFSEEDDPVGRVVEFNSIYATASPKQQRRLSELLEHGTYVGRKLAELNNYTCQVCGQRGFEQKSGRPYIETHHILALHKKEPHSLCSDNILVVCPNCHRKLHFAQIVLQTLPDERLKIVLNGIEYIVKRNTLNNLRNL